MTSTTIPDYELGCRDMAGRMLLAVVFIYFGMMVSGCTFNRNAPVLEINSTIEDSANGNTVPLGGL